MNVLERIQQLKKEKNAVILAHNYQLPEVQDIADYNGDSLGLSVMASKTDADVIVFCGVYFMAETAKIISPQKKVLIPEPNAGCPMADMITADQLRELKAKHPNAKTMCYVNSTAEVKAECDICCTSGNALELTKKAFAPDQEVIFVPDQHLANYTARELGREFIVYPGYCPTHHRIIPEFVDQARDKHPNAEVLVHPECSLAVIDRADKALSTGQMAKYVKESEQKEFIIGTENGMIYRLQQDNPEKIFHKLSDLLVCPNMKKTSLDKVLAALENDQHEVIVDDEIANKARGAIEAMLKYS